MVVENVDWDNATTTAAHENRSKKVLCDAACQVYECTPQTICEVIAVPKTARRRLLTATHTVTVNLYEPQENVTEIIARNSTRTPIQACLPVCETCNETTCYTGRRTDRAETPPEKKSSNKTLIIIISSSVGGAVILVAIGLFVWYKKSHTKYSKVSPGRSKGEKKKKKNRARRMKDRL